MSKKYYEAYEERYKAIHSKGMSWSSDVDTKIVRDTILKYGITTDSKILEIGCGEGRDARVLLEKQYDLLATDISQEAITYCQTHLPKYHDHFQVLDVLSDTLSKQYDMIYGVAVIHMLVLDEDRARFYQFIHDHLEENGIALICTMGDGIVEMQSDISQAFTLQEREHESGKVLVAGTSCRMVSFDTMERELTKSHLEIIEKGITQALPDFNSLMYVVVRRN